MSVTIDGANKLIILSGSTAWVFGSDIYPILQDWAALSGNMKYTLPCSASGYLPLGGSVYTDIIFTINYGWKLQPSGYTTGTPISVTGTLITIDSSNRVTAPTIGGVPEWTFQVATYGTVTAGGGGSAPTPEQNAEAVLEILDPQLIALQSTVNDNQALILSN